MDTYRAKLTAFLVVVIGVFCATAVSAQGRTTPVEVKNTPLVQIDEGANKVSASQSGDWGVAILGIPSVAQGGAWNVGITNTPNVSVTNTPNVSVTNSPTVKIDGTTNVVKSSQYGAWSVGVSGTAAVTQSGTWTVGLSGTPNVNVTNTPSVSVSNSPVVRIDGTANVVYTPTKGRAVLLFGSNQVIPTGSSVTSATYDCTGYKELRFLIENNNAGSALRALIEFQSPLGAGFWSIVHTEYVTDNAMAFSVPVYGASCRVRIVNSLGSTTTIWSQSWVYMVN